MKGEDLYAKAHRLSKAIDKEIRMGKMSEIHALIQEGEAIKEQLGYVDPDSMAMNKIAKALAHHCNPYETEGELQDELIEILQSTGRTIPWPAGDLGDTDEK